jgi:hypothetical protein
MSSGRVFRMAWLLGALLLAACGGSSATPEGSGAAVDLVQRLPGAEAVAGWTPEGEAQVYGTENLYDLVDGQADAYFAYGFEQVAVQTYQGTGGATLRVEVWQMASPADAYGLYSTSRGDEPVAVGNGGDADPGRRLGFWQDRYQVRLFAVQPIPDADLVAVAEALSAALPAGGEEPALVGGLPQAGLIAGSPLFFRQEISIQDYLWLGGENVLGLGPETEGVLARYDLEGGMAQLLLVRYGDSAAAQAGLAALERAGLEELVAAQTRGELLGAVFGGADVETADRLLASALEAE